MAMRDSKGTAESIGSDRGKRGRVATLSRAAYRAGLWILFGGAAAELIFHAAHREDWNGACVARTSGASRG